MDCSDVFKDVNYTKDCDIVLPAISVSNAGQLAVDLLIQSTGASKIGNVWHEAFIPLVGAHPYNDGSTDLCTEFEVYKLTQKNILIIQFRSPVWQNKEEEFLNLLVNWFLKMEVKQVVILSSLHDYERLDNQIKDPHIRCCICPLTMNLYESTLRQLNCVHLESRKGVESDDDQTIKGVMTRDMYLPGAGFTQSLHLKCIENGLPCVSFFKFCSDGDNTPEALELAKIVDEWLNVLPTTSSNEAKTFTQPPSWKYIFGGPSPQELFP